MRILLALSAVALVSTAAIAQDTTAPAAPAPAKKKVDDGDKIICKREQFVGSVIPRKICHTKAEWQAAEEASHDFLDEKRRMGVDQQSIRGRSGG
jgi:hypothetical protein